QIQTLQYLEIHFSSQETCNEVFQANHSIQNEESFDPSNEIAVSKSNQEKEEHLQESVIHQLIVECSTEASEKQSMEDTMLDLVKICQEKKFLCIHDDIDDLIESTLNSKLLLINSNSQHLDKKEHEVKNVVEQPAKRGNLSIQSLQNFRFVHKSSISFRDTSQISSIHAIAPILSTKEPEHLLSMGYEHLSITPETKSDEVTESNDENLLPIPNLDSSDDESFPDEDVPAKDFKVYSNPLFDEDEINSDKLDPLCFNVESDFVESLLNRDTFIDFSSKFDFTELYAEIADIIIESIPSLPIPVHDGDSHREEIDVVTKTDDVLPPSVKNNDDLFNDSLLEEVNLFLSDNSIPLGIENIVDDLEGDIRFLEELLIDDSILSHESPNSNFEDNPSIPRPHLEPPDAETDTGKKFQS
nr:hypothetical protein [Tanacetum cinerariifolium]